jgi:hypothetical protein
MNLAEMRTANATALTAAGQSVERLKKLRATAPTAQLATITVHLDSAMTEKHLLEALQAHLNAAGTTVKPLPPALAQDLDAIAARIDKAIHDDAIVNATLEVVTVVLKDAEQMRGLVGQSTA